MSSSQTMTAPAVGHRPSEAGRSMSSLYDYSGSQHSPENDQHHLPSQQDSPPDSAIRNDSAPDDHHPFDSNGLPSLSGMATVKSEADDQAFHALSNGQDSQADIRRQSAASALLAQLLGGQQAPGSDSNQQNGDSGVVNGRDNEQDNEQNQGTEHTEPGVTEDWQSQLGNVPPSAEPTNGDQTQQPSAAQQHTDDTSVQHSGLPFSTDAHTGTAPVKTADHIEGLTDPLLFAKPSLDHSDFFPPLDFSTAPETPLDSLQHNEILNGTYMPQSGDLTALGYTEGTVHDGSGSVAGSEPRIQAFAKLEFDDGHFYCNTYSFILGRDVRAARAAHQREFQVRQAMRRSRAKSSSGGNASHTPVRAKPEGSGIMGSVVSDRGGIMGFDPDVPLHMQSHISRRSSNSSHGDTGGLLHATPAQLQATTDYNALAMQSLQESNGDAKPVDPLALLPSPDSCPTIPIHPPATADGSAAGHRGISRKHVKIAYNFDKNLFEMEVLGRNGAFIGADWLSPSQIRPLHSGDYIQIGGVRIRFLLPDVPIGETGADREEEPFVAEAQENAEAPVTAENDQEDTENKDGKPTKLVLKTKDADGRPGQSMESPGEQPPVRRRGPGRPPKDGIMSKRERAELAREQKLAARREANGGVTPPPQAKPKAGKTTTTPGGTAPQESAVGESPNSKPEKRKYTKRKKPDGSTMDIPLPSTEGGQFAPDNPPQEYVRPPPVKKRKPSRSPSPNYPPESAYTPEDLAKPPYNYAVLIFDALTEASTPMTLKQIYRALKLKYPYFRFKCETEGWTSSVRHNLNGNSHLFMHAERDGKGWSWQLRPGASVEKEKKRRPSPPPPPAQPPQAPPASVTPQYMPPQNSYGNQPNGQQGMTSTHFQFSSMSSNQYPPPPPPPPPSTATPAPAPAPAPTPTPQHSTPYPPPAQAAASSPFPIPSPIRNNLPPAFAQTTPTTYTSPYASDPPPQLLQYQQSQQAQAQAQHMQPPPPPQHHQQSPYPPPNPQPLPPNNHNHQPQSYPPNSGPPPQHQPQQHQQPYSMGQNNGPTPMDEEASFLERANKAIDDFEAVLLEDYEDKDYIKGVLKSARARALGEATESSVPGGEPPDETVLLDALRNMIKGLRGE
ncbi:hypothetical protein BJX61DRAFT_368711 [Aspergillus egyptiacus]|nr:hypothetical protein BJX61DRAFT_368711 [Aspergillus egyptiacus]